MVLFGRSVNSGNGVRGRVCGIRSDVGVLCSGGGRRWDLGKGDGGDNGERGHDGGDARKTEHGHSGNI